VSGVKPSVRFEEPTCKVLTVGSKDLLQDFHTFVASRLRNHLKPNQHGQEAIRIGLDKVYAIVQSFYLVQSLIPSDSYGQLLRR